MQAISLRLTILMALVLGISTTALAGPPLICHSIDIGNAKSLPWVSHGWNLTGGENYDVKNLAKDTLAVLDSNDSVLVHMETLRRATIYAKTDPQVAKELLTKLHSRATSGNSLALFDEGYLVETYRQWFREQNPAVGLDGYEMVKKALAQRGQDAQMEFAAALIVLGSHSARTADSEQRDHVRKSMEGAKSDPLLAKNLTKLFGGDGRTTIAEMLQGSAKKI